MAATTGSSLLPDIGKLSYNGVSWSSLYSSRITGTDVLDNSGRTIKYVQYNLTVDGVVTLDNDFGDKTTDRIMSIMRTKLAAQAGQLIYTLKGFGNPFVVNSPGGTLNDVAWGPIPKTLEFIPLGGSRSARVLWTVNFHLPEQPAGTLGVLQFNEDISIGYDDKGYSTINLSGTLEVPLTRPSQTTRTLTKTVDDYRQTFMNKIAASFDLTRFRVVTRKFDVSRDRRTLEWGFSIQELPPMGLPGGITVAHGEITTRPLKGQYLMSTIRWLSTMRSTYIVPKGTAPRLAWLAFLSLWNFRMRQSEFGGILGSFGAIQTLEPVNVSAQNSRDYNNSYSGKVQGFIGQSLNNIPANVINIFQKSIDALPVPNAQKNTSMPMSLEVNERLYLDSSEISFAASWQFLCRLDHLLLATGLWRQTGLEGGNFWAQSVQNISGGKSWLQNQVNPAGDVIVDFGL